MLQGHPIDVDLERILPILAREIYTSPFAFLRENVQNAFDAIRMQQHRERTAGVFSEHRVQIDVNGDRLSIRDSGIGMSHEQLARFFWSIGRSGKHTAEAKQAGVVGTFGIGGMANFGVCSRLEVVTRTRDATRSVRSYAERSRLSATEECVFYELGPLDFDAGTLVTGTMMSPIDHGQVTAYLAPFVEYLNVPVYVGDLLLSGRPFPSAKREEGASRVIEEGRMKATVFVRALQNGQAEIELEELTWDGKATEMAALFSTCVAGVSAYQHGFMLATVPVATIFGLGGVINSALLRPTAGREAVTDESRTIVQTLVGVVEKALAEHLAGLEGLADRFSAFFRYLSHHGRWDLAGTSTVRLYGRDARIRLGSLQSESPGNVYFAREGHDQSIMQAYHEQSKVIVLLSSEGHRQKVERNFLTSLCKAVPLEDSVTCVRVIDDLSFEALALKYRLQEKIHHHFLIDGVRVQAGELTHGAMVWVPKSSGRDRMLFLDFRHPHVNRLVELRDSLSFDAVLDIFVRDSVLPHLESAFPELRKRDFDALLRRLQSTVEYLEIDPEDISRIQELAAITKMSPEDVATVFGGRKPGPPRPTVVRRADVAAVAQEVNRVVEQASGKAPELVRQELEIGLLETEVDAKILDATDVRPEIGLARFYLGLTRDAHVLYRRVFLERNPTADFSWGGHRAGYLFYSYGSAVIYYDVQFEDLIGGTGAHRRSGTLRLEHGPLVLKNNVFIPIPNAFEHHMVPTEKPLRFTVRHQIQGVGSTAVVAS